MSKSYRHSPVYGHGGGSEKQDKRLYNRALRSRTRQDLRTCDDFDDVVLPEVCDVSNPWSMAKDGKSYCTWLAAWRHTLARVTRVRDGHSRFILVYTDATRVRAYEEERRIRLRSWFRYREDDSFDWRDEAHRSLELIRK